jgi:hypothetical protein
MGGPGSHGKKGNKGNRQMIGRKGGQAPFMPPPYWARTLTDAINARTEADGPKGYLPVKVVAQAFGVTPQSLSHLDNRAFRGMITDQEAFWEGKRREVGVQTSDLIWDDERNKWTWPGEYDEEEDTEAMYGYEEEASTDA